MKTKNGSRRREKLQDTSTVRASISFPPNVYSVPAGIANVKRVSLAWVVREAAEEHLFQKWPQLKGQG